MELEKIKASLHAFLLQELLPGEKPSLVTYTTPLVTSGILDSVAILDLVSHLEESYGIKVEAHEVGVEHLNTIDVIAEFVLSKKSRSNPD
jgi:acyl carrier protein